MVACCPMENFPLAVHVTGTFGRMKVRAVARLCILWIRNAATAAMWSISH